MSENSEHKTKTILRSIPDGAMWTRLDGFGMACSGEGWRLKVRSEEDVVEMFRAVKSTDLKVAFRGAGVSYGDAAINQKELICDCSEMNNILDWDPATGIIHLEGGVTVEQIWRHVIGDGYWPPVVSGTMAPTVAGALAMNIHGKNCFVKGPIGDHVLGMRVVTPEGEVLDCSPDENTELFETVISSFGSLGFISSARIQLTKVHSGRISVRAFCTSNLSEMFRCFAKNIDDSDYLVGWIDGFKRGSGLGRGIVHSASYLKEGEDARAGHYLEAKAHELPTRLFKVIPKKWMWRLVKPFANRLGMRMINALKYRMSWLFDRGRAHLETLGGFNFLLDYIPDWRNIYKPGGFIQHQSFLPKESAEDGFRRILEICHSHQIPPFLAVFKRHRPDRFRLTHGLDGFSLALDLPIRSSSRGRILEMTAEIDALVCSLGGRFYPAKDATVRAEHYQSSIPPEDLDRFIALKERLDPETRLQSDLYRRLFQNQAPNSGLK